MRRTLTVLALAVVVGSVLLRVDGSGQAQAGTGPCDTGTLTGGYAITGTGALGDQDMGLVGTLLFDGAGSVIGGGTAVVHAPALVEPIMLSEGSYSLKGDCTGSTRFFTHHMNLSVIDHYHIADLVVSDGGREFSLLYVATEFASGAPSTPVESFVMRGQRL